MPVWCQGPIISIDIADYDDTLESDIGGGLMSKKKLGLRFSWLEGTQ